MQRFALQGLNARSGILSRLKLWCRTILKPCRWTSSRSSPCAIAESSRMNSCSGRSAGTKSTRAVSLERSALMAIGSGAKA